MDYKKLYYHLFNVVTDSITAIREQNYGIAQKMLMQGQLECEEIYLQAENDGAIKTKCSGREED